MHIIQKSVYPSYSLCTEIELYFRLNGFSDLDIKKSTIKLVNGGEVSTSTYFNSFSVGKWKRYTLLDDLDFNITFKGNIKVIFKLNRLYYSDKILDEIYLTNSTLSVVSIPLCFWKNITDGMLSFTIISLGDSEIKNFSYSTNTLPSQKVKLGIVITHFNRQKFVLSAVERLKSNLLLQEEYRDKVSLFIVDNSQNLPEISNVDVIPNENLGGAGGFTRGLITLQEHEEGYSHCLFMDDDASCEVESITRTLALLEYSTSSGLCVAGAMLRESEMFRQHENGARFDGLCKPNKCGLDLRSIHNLLINEEEEHIDYGGWWFFAFPIKQIKNYAFPYFVRGDDIGFGLKHSFNTITLNGISTWQEDFTLKNGPLPYYLDARNHIMQYLQELIPYSFLGIIKTTAKMCLKNLLTYNYETALAVIYAMNDVAKGSDFWRKNVDMNSKRKEILELIDNEKIRDISVDEISFSVEGNPIESKFFRLIRWMTLNGHLLPRFLFKKGYVWQNKGFGGSLREVYRYSKVLYIHWPSRKGFILNHNKRKFFSYLFRYVSALFNLYINRKRLSKDYKNSYDELTSKEFWKAQFKPKSRGLDYE
jgi:glycosyltransferase